MPVSIGIIAAVLVVVACGSQSTLPAASSAPASATSTAAAPSQTEAASSTAAASPLVGTWTRVNDCAAFVGALEEADLADLAPGWLVGAGYFASEADIDLDDPCAGATEVEHSHFFTADGEFGSFDENGAQVDDGRFELVDEDTMAVGEGQLLVDFAVRPDGNTLSFTVPLPEPCEGPCRDDYAWAISAFYPGEFERTASGQ